MFGFLNVYKPVGITSFDVIRKLRNVLKIKQIGHTGTLDPLAEGVLPICIGKSTKLIDYLNEDKAYVADLKFGYVSETYDVESEQIKFSEKTITRDELICFLEKFTGEIEQIPPMYSAIKLNGKKLYEYARKGTVIEDIPKRIVNISDIHLVDFGEVNQTARIFVACSKGTYIRSIIHDLGQISGCGAVMTKLIRVKSGKFCVENAINIDDIKSVEIVAEKLINPISVMDNPTLELSDEEYSKVITGQKIKNRGFLDGAVVLLLKTGELISIARVEQSLIKVIKVFV